MKTYKDLSGNYQDCIITYQNYEKYDIEDGISFGYGYNLMSNSKILKEMHGKRLYFNGELPCSFSSGWNDLEKSIDLEGNFDNIFSICTLTNKWANELFFNNRKKFIDGMFTIDEINIPKEKEKIYDSIFYGSVCGKEHEGIIKTVCNFNSNFITLGENYWNPNENIDWNCLSGLITHRNIDTFLKWDIIQKTKVVPIVNKLYLHKKHIDNIKQIPHYEKNECFSHLDMINQCPQLKPRIVEASLFKSLMVVKRDPWNLIECWFSPGEDFLYFESLDELYEIIRDSSRNFEKYSNIVESAYNKAIEMFTTEKMIKYMKENI